LVSCQKDTSKESNTNADYGTTVNLRNYTTDTDQEAHFFDVNYTAGELGIQNLRQGISSGLYNVYDRIYDDPEKEELLQPFYDNNQYPCWTCAEMEYVGRNTYYIPVFDLDDNSMTAMIWATFDDSETNLRYLGLDYVRAVSKHQEGIFKYWDWLSNYFILLAANENPSRHNFFYYKTIDCVPATKQHCVCNAPNREPCEGAIVFGGDNYGHLECYGHCGGGDVDSDTNPCDGVVCPKGEVCRNGACVEVVISGGGGDNGIPVEDPYNDDGTINILDTGSCYLCFGTDDPSTGGGTCHNCSVYPIIEREGIIADILDYIDDNHPNIDVAFVSILVMENNSQFDHTTLILSQHIDVLSSEAIEAYLNFIKNHPQFLVDEGETLELLYDPELTTQLDQFLSDNIDDSISVGIAHIMIDMKQSGNLTLPINEVVDNANLLHTLLIQYPLNLANSEVAYLLLNENVINEVSEINAGDREGNYAQAASNLYISLASQNLLNLTINDALSHIDMQTIIADHLTTHEMSDRLALNTAIWYMIFQTESMANGGDIGDWLRGIKTAIKEGWDQVLSTVSQHISAAFNALPQNSEEWFVVGSIMAPILLDLGLDFVPIVGDVKAFAEAFNDIASSNYADGAIGLIGALAGIIPIGDILRSIPKIKNAFTALGGGFAIVKALKNVNLSIFSHLSDYIDNGFKAVWDKVNGKLIFKKGNQVVGDLSDAMAKAMKGLANTGLKNNIPWLKRASKWVDEGADFAADGSGKLTKNGEDILQLKNDKILPDKYDLNNSGAPVGDASDGYQVVKNGDNLSVRRVPETSGYSQADLTELTQHPNAHVLERHGHDVTDDALIKRANTGIAPDGNPGSKPSYSSKFEDSSKVSEAVNGTKQGTTAFINGTQSGNRRIVSYTSSGNMGKGVPRDGNSFQTTKKVKAIYEDVGGGNYQLLTMYPDF